MKKEFKGRARSKKPKSLIKEKGINQLDDLFLALALIYNDIKGIILFQDLLNENYKPISSNTEAHDGEFGGLNMQIVRILSIIINEFLELLNESKIIQSEEFNNLINNLEPKADQLWRDLITIAKRGKVKENPTNYALMMIRGNITAHYKNAGKNLRQGFIDKFYNRKRDKKFKNDAAYYSLEDTLEATRFYYADAAAEEYMIQISNNWDNYLEDINQLVRAIHSGIYFLLKDYLKNKD